MFVSAVNVVINVSIKALDWNAIYPRSKLRRIALLFDARSESHLTETIARREGLFVQLVAPPCAW
jgi:hypothetical protein